MKFRGSREASLTTLEVMPVPGRKQKGPLKGGLSCLVPRRGLEPPPTYVDQHLKLARLPIPPPGHFTNQSDFQTVLPNRRYDKNDTSRIARGRPHLVTA